MSGYTAQNVRRYRCYSQLRHHAGEPYCHGAVRADALEPVIWRKIERVLSNPEIIMGELARQAQQGVEAQRDTVNELRVIQNAVDALEREAQRWDSAYAREVIDLAELKSKKHEIAERRQRLLDQQAAAEEALHQAQQRRTKIQDVLLYCHQVKERLSTLDMPHKLVALDALDIRVIWTPGAPLQIKGSIPIDATVSATP